MSVRTDILQFLRTPRAFAEGVPPGDQELWLRGLRNFVLPQIASLGDYELGQSQIDAWLGLANRRVGLIQGPPGTGKTYTLSWMALGYLQARTAAGLPCRILVTAFTLNAVANLLQAIQDKSRRYLSQPPLICYFGNTPAGGLSTEILRLPVGGRSAIKRAWEELETPQLVTGCSIWALNKILGGTDDHRSDGFTAPLYDLVCIDEASQMVVGHGLMALAGLSEQGRVLVAGDDKQLPPVRSTQEQVIDGRQLGSSLYDFLKSARVDEFPLEETFRLNAPLTQFPETKFYPGRYRSAAEVADARLKLRDNWEEGLQDWERIVLDPQFPVCVLLHDGPASGTSNLFEANIAVRLVRRFHSAMVPGDEEIEMSPEIFWQKRMAVVSPHRAQNAAIRAALSNHPAGSSLVVETVDKIQGKERDALIASYTVSDPEFALAEAEFIFSLERFNVTITRAKTKFVLIISRRLLDVVPSDEEMLDAAQVLREFVFDSEEVGTCSISDPEGRPVAVNIRVRGFVKGGELPLLSDRPQGVQDDSAPEMTGSLEELIGAIREIAVGSKYGTATDYQLRKKLYREVPFSELRDLLRLGHIHLKQRQGSYGPFWVARPLDLPKVPFSAESETVIERLEEVVTEARKGRFAPFYTEIQNRFVWVDETGVDILWPVIESMARDGLVRIDTVNGSPTVDWIYKVDEKEELPSPPTEELTELDYLILNGLEDLEAKRVNFGVYESWLSAPELAAELRQSPFAVADALRRLHLHGYAFIEEDGRIRSRMAELAREVRYVKQRFAVGDSGRRPFLVRSLKVELQTRDKPIRDKRLSDALKQIEGQLEDNDLAISALHGVAQMLRETWGEDPELAGFQARSLRQILLAWVGRSPQSSFVITADTGSGKTEAACLPLIAGAAYDEMKGIRGTRSVLVYPRVRLAANQAQRLAGYLAAFSRVDGMPTLTLGLQNFQVPGGFDRMHESLESIWKDKGGGARDFPFFGCPNCTSDLLIHPGRGINNIDSLSCFKCGWEYTGWVGSKTELVRSPPHFFLPVTESLHQWQSTSRYGMLFGDSQEFASPRAVLADEIHLYTHIHGTQVGYALRRLLARATYNTNSRLPRLAIGMSATLGEPSRIWGELIGRDGVVELTPEQEERQLNPRGREYFYFVQPEVESRGKDVAGASTTIQSLMCLAHGMRRRTGKDGGYRSLVFLDSIDKLKRLHGDYQDAEEGKRLASLRTRLFDDDPGVKQPRRECCGQPPTCDRFRSGECWFFAATDDLQVSARGRYRRGVPLVVADRPVFSGTSGRVEDLIRGSDIVFTTSSLEVGYDDPDIALVYQHYSPNNLASFIQRKGRGGRGADDRPITGVTLSPYSPRDSWYFRRPRIMLDGSNFRVPLNMGNYFVRRGQVLSVVLDALAAHGLRRGQPGLTATLSLCEDVVSSADKMVRAVFGGYVYSELEVADLQELWSQVIGMLEEPISHATAPEELRKRLPWVPQNLFSNINLPDLKINHEDEEGRLAQQHEEINLALDSLTPGNMTRRYGFNLVHWVPPKEGRHPWLSERDYTESLEFSIKPLESGGDGSLLREVPLEARADVGSEVHPKICRPRSASLEKAGKVRGEWNSFWHYEPSTGSVKLIGGVEPAKGLKIHHKSRGSLRGFTYVDADESLARPLPTRGIEKIAARFEGYLQNKLSGRRTGLSITSFYWGADSELRLEDPKQEVIPITQIFTHPNSHKTLLHGYKVETEGVRLHLDGQYLTDFTRAEIERMKDTAQERWHKGQMLRFIIGSQARAAGINTYEANRAAELFFSAAGLPKLRERLKNLIRRWDSVALGNLLQDTYSELLRQHPLLSQRRVERIAGALGDRKFHLIFSGALEDIRNDQKFAAYLRSVLLHSIAVRMKQSFVLYGRGDERQVIVHAKIPIQFGDDAYDVITVAENGANGDGTTRMFVESLEEVLENWSSGTIAECPNALEDTLVDRVYKSPAKHRYWRAMDPRNLNQMLLLARDLEMPQEAEDSSLQSVMRLLYGTETVGRDRIELFVLHSEIRLIAERLGGEMGREPSGWELVSAAVNAAIEADALAPQLTNLLLAYQRLEDATLEESLSAEARLADQVYKLSARLCVDGCQACLHSGSDLMPDLLAEASVSRSLLGRFWSSL